MKYIVVYYSVTAECTVGDSPNCRYKLGYLHALLDYGLPLLMVRLFWGVSANNRLVKRVVFRRYVRIQDGCTETAPLTPANAIVHVGVASSSALSAHFIIIMSTI